MKSKWYKSKGGRIGAITLFIFVMYMLSSPCFSVLKFNPESFWAINSFGPAGGNCVLINSLFIDTSPGDSGTSPLFSVAFLIVFIFSSLIGFFIGDFIEKKFFKRRRR